jgi:phage baseplate assembly protein W
MATISPQPYGIALPITLGESGYFAQTYSALEQIKTNLNLLLKTKKGERRMSPDFGSGLWSVLFEQITDDIAPIIDGTIRKDINRWMPYVNVNSVDVVQFPDNNYNRLNVTVKFTVPSIGEYDEQILQVVMNSTNI